MGNKEYLNEEAFQKTNKKVKTAGVIVMLIGIVAILCGIFMLVKGSDGVREFAGMPIVLGIGVTIWGCMIRYIVANQRQINAYMATQQIPVEKEKLEKMSPSMGTAAKEIAKGVKEGLNEDQK